MKKILVIEDEPQMRRNLVTLLRLEAFEPLAAENGRTGVDLARRGPPDLILCDVMMPGLDGYEVLKELHNDPATMNIPFIFLTAKGERLDVRTGMNLGADDYLIKPFAFAELLARVRALLRRGAALPERLCAGDLTLDCIRRRVSRGGRVIELAPKEFSILEYLMRNQGHPLSRTMIVEHVWDTEYDGLTNIVDVYIRHLRSKIDDEADMKLIRTVRGIGYMLDPTAPGGEEV